MTVPSKDALDLALRLVTQHAGSVEHPAELVQSFATVVQQLIDEREEMRAARDRWITDAVVDAQSTRLRELVAGVRKWLARHPPPEQAGAELRALLDAQAVRR